MLEKNVIILQVHYCNTCTSTSVSGHVCHHTSVVGKHEWTTNMGEVTSFNTWIHSFLDTVCQNILFQVGKTRNILKYNKFHLSLNVLNFLKGQNEQDKEGCSFGLNALFCKQSQVQWISTYFWIQAAWSQHYICKPTRFLISDDLLHNTNNLVTALRMQLNWITHFIWLTLVYK
jgi:hypothetical protein